jgi:serine/threonine-protein kinase RsbW
VIERKRSGDGLLEGRGTLAQPQTDNRLVLHSRFGEVARAQDTILDAVRERDYTDAQIFAIKLSLEEALTNAIKHGNRLDPSKTVEVAYRITSDQVWIQICDEGGGFRPDGVPDPTLDENLERPCGRGVMLMRAYMTHVSFSDTGNCVTMIKQRTCHGPEHP